MYVRPLMISNYLQVPPNCFQAFLVIVSQSVLTAIGAIAISIIQHYLFDLKPRL